MAIALAGGYEDRAFVADLYDQFPPYRDRADLKFFVRAAEESGGAGLELGCGTGRVLIPTARAGVEVVGLDLSHQMLEVCRARLRDEPEDVQSRVQLVEADMRQFELGRAFRLATTPFRSFQHLTTVEDQVSCLVCIHGHLTDDGRLILDIFDPSLEHLVADDIGQEVEAGPEFATPDGRRIVRRSETVGKDRVSQIIHVELVYCVTHPDGREERLTHAFPMRYLFPFEAEHLLARCGFEVEHLYGDFDKSPPGGSIPASSYSWPGKRSRPETMGPGAPSRTYGSAHA